MGRSSSRLLLFDVSLDQRREHLAHVVALQSDLGFELAFKRFWDKPRDLSIVRIVAFVIRFLKLVFGLIGHVSPSWVHRGGCVK